MNEVEFHYKNIKKWQTYESLLQKSKIQNPDELYELYIELTNDLAYVKTYFPESESEKLLNQLTLRTHGLIYKNKPIKKNRVINFWKIDFPLLFNSSLKEFYIALSVFVISVLIGLISSKYESDFASIILGNQYVNMTLDNIDKGDPMAVYKQANELPMFLGITINNIKVALLAFTMGIFTSLSTCYIIFRNGVMLGAFHGFLSQNGIILDAFATIWIHGIIEIFSIIVAGTAGIIIGNSFLFPGTYKRSVALKKAGKKAAKIVFGLIPFFIIAGFFEGFLTRHTELPYWIRFLFIFLNTSFIVFYFFIYPKKLTKSQEHAGKSVTIRQRKIVR